MALADFLVLENGLKAYSSHPGLLGKNPRSGHSSHLGVAPQNSLPARTISACISL